MKNIKQTNKKRQSPELFGSADLRSGGKKTKTKHINLPLLIQQSLLQIPEELWLAQQQVSLADIITGVSDTAP